MKGINFLWSILGFSLLFVIVLSMNSLAICSDTDSGIDYYTKGDVISNNETLTDYCTQSVLVEYYCDPDNPDRILNSIHRCQEGCGGGSCGGVDEEIPIIIPPYNGTENNTNYTPSTPGSGPGGSTPSGDNAGIGGSPSGSGANSGQQTIKNSTNESIENAQEQTQKSQEPSMLSPKKMKSYQNILLIIIGTVIGILFLSLFIISAVIKKGKHNNK
jgi:hypothetical protein